MTSTVQRDAVTLVPDSHSTRHWLGQRLSAIALVPLGLWFLYSLLALPDLGHRNVSAWIAEPMQAALLALFAWCALWHSALGLQVVVEDYVPRHLQAPIIRLLQAVHVAAAIIAAYSVWLLAYGQSA